VNHVIGLRKIGDRGLFVISTITQPCGRFAALSCSMKRRMKASSAIDWPDTLIEMLMPRLLSMLRYAVSVWRARSQPSDRPSAAADSAAPR